MMGLVGPMPGKPLAEKGPQVLTRNRVSRGMVIEYLDQGPGPLAVPIGKSAIEIPDE